ncbi:MAG: type II toxin-antitoxin system YafQ family toxin [Thiofilum sp.]|uniref:type II toxin-antitoxin system RelE/ParE family toxin n=1 Tax=Thiofilum sp. TaxID=2212733 RepID=UPI0025EBF708|nr:type II toxin-antitoxin system YafQ family toxin [Thiofilum sp.]MBK8453620.1 type II toxin-antitoxin system YafQ family toxin [Thiofilum sp.]
MRKIERTNAFKRDFRRHGELDSALIEVLWKLSNDELLPESYRDHALTGDWVDFRECHVHPDLLLIYRKPDAQTLQLVRLGSHSELDL